MTEVEDEGSCLMDVQVTMIAIYSDAYSTTFGCSRIVSHNTVKHEAGRGSFPVYQPDHNAERCVDAKMIEREMTKKVRIADGAFIHVDQ